MTAFAMMFAALATTLSAAVASAAVTSAMTDVCFGGSTAAYILARRKIGRK